MPDKSRFLKGTETVLGFRKSVMWLTQTLTYEINLAKPLIWKVMGLSRSRREGSTGPKSPWIQGFRSDGPDKASNTIY
jgi:hypothetical protein